MMWILAIIAVWALYMLLRNPKPKSPKAVTVKKPFEQTYWYGVLLALCGVQVVATISLDKKPEEKKED